MTESQLQKQVVRYISLIDSSLIVISDPNGLKVTIGQAKQLKSIRLPANGGHPDLWIMKPNKEYAGCFIELKKQGEKIFKVRPFPPEYKSDHLEKQASIHDRLRELGYFGGFACGFDEAKNIIDEYLRL